MSIACILALVLLLAGPARFARAALYREEELIRLEKQNVGGGKGPLAGRYAFTRDMPSAGHAVKEIVWLSLEPGDSIGVHQHVSNEDLYVIVSGTGTLTDADGKEYAVKPGDINIARKGDSHGLANTGAEPLVFISVIAE